MQIDCDPRNLRGTIDRWNGFVDAGHDGDFNRGHRKYDQWLGDPFHGPNPALGRIEKAPFMRSMSSLATSPLMAALSPIKKAA